MGAIPVSVTETKIVTHPMEVHYLNHRRAIVPVVINVPMTEENAARGVWCDELEQSLGLTRVSPPADADDVQLSVSVWRRTRKVNLPLRHVDAKASSAGSLLDYAWAVELAWESASIALIFIRDLDSLLTFLCRVTPLLRVYG